MLQKNDLIQVKITAMASDGNGIAKQDGFVLFVPLSAVGDILSVRIVKVQKNYAFGKIEEILTPSPDRVDPGCPVYGRCGGCAFRHISYEAELHHKLEFIRSNLRRLGGLEPELLPITGSARTSGYRNKAQYPVRERDGLIEAGFFAKRSHRIVSCAGCDLQPAFFEGIVEYIKRFLLENNVTVYNEETGKGLVRHIYLRFGEVTGQVMVCLVLNGTQLPHAQRFVKGLLEVCPEVVSIVLNHNRGKDNVILGEKCTTLFGLDSISDQLCGVTFQISPLSFYQVNRSSAEALYNIARDLAGLTGNELLVDLYCGAGTIGLSMAKHVREVVGVEIVRDAVENAKLNAKNCGAENARFLCADAADAAKQLANEGLEPDVIVVDPPRKGCDPAVLEAMVQMSPEKIIMISCNSASLARDCKTLSAQGYRLVKVAPVDLFPRTAHVESVGLLLKDQAIERETAGRNHEEGMEVPANEGAC